jgi:hypothetical protein
MLESRVYSSRELNHEITTQLPLKIANSRKEWGRRSLETTIKREAFFAQKRDRNVV